MNSTYPLVSVLTPVYNGEQYLAECIESVINQKYSNWEYIIVNNCSTDRTIEIALEYAKKDSRIRVENNRKFVCCEENHNIAFRLISNESKYCKVVSSDDVIFPDCIKKLVEVAEKNKTIGFVGSYQLSGGGDNWSIKWVGLPYTTTIVPGHSICRWHLLGRPYVFGTPTSVLYRSDITRKTSSFFPNLGPHGDTSTFYKYLDSCDFGFVHQVLSYERIHEKAMSSRGIKIDTYRSAYLDDLIEYGPKYLTNNELKNRISARMNDYYDSLASGFVNFKDKEYWEYHKNNKS